LREILTPRLLVISDFPVPLIVLGFLPFIVWRVWVGLGLPDKHVRRDQRCRDMLKPKIRK
jgi:hypothetical protein